MNAGGGTLGLKVIVEEVENHRVRQDTTWEMQKRELCLEGEKILSQCFMSFVAWRVFGN